MNRSSDREAVIDLYERHAHAYDRERGRSLRQERPWLERFLGHVPAGGTVLDVGCGMGEPIAAHLVERGFRVVGTAASPAMIGLCRVRLPAGDFERQPSCRIVGSRIFLELSRALASDDPCQVVGGCAECEKRPDEEI